MREGIWRSYFSLAGGFIHRSRFGQAGLSVHVLTEASAEEPTLGFYPFDEGVAKFIHGGFGGNFYAAVDFDFFSHGGTPFGAYNII